MRIGELYGGDRPIFSFEFFPPRTDAGFASLYRTVEELKRLDPDFVSVTWGAGGSSRRKTVEIVAKIQRELGVTAMAHLSCIGSTPGQLAETLDRLSDEGIENVLALGGDRPEDYVAPAGAFTYANELAEFIRRRWSFSLAGACYPETHPLAPSPETDLENLARKVAAGAEVLITQLFFDNDFYFRFVDRARSVGITQPIVPGIMPIISASNIRRITKMCGSKIPSKLEARLSEVEGDDSRTLEVGVAWATQQSRELLERGAPGIHFYTMNRSPATRRVFEQIQNA
jgi:methylenetetrahydrofolate reductase (NADPH)